MKEWKWGARLYYGPLAQPPERSGQIAVETTHGDDTSLYMEVEAAKTRPDIGMVRVKAMPDGPWLVVYQKGIEAPVPHPAQTPTPGVWQPIETAPKDGTLVDLWVAHWKPGGEGHRRPNCFWEGEWRQQYSEAVGCSFGLDGYGTPTHWMLPPAPPLSANSHADVGQGLRPDRS